VDESPAAVFTPPIESRKGRHGRRKVGKTKSGAGKLESLTLKDRRHLKKWVLDNSMPEEGRNLTAAGIIEHISDVYGIKVFFLFFFSFFLIFAIEDEFVLREDHAQELEN
jgi:hypothetical protein